jgi:hypothetical protein
MGAAPVAQTERGTPVYVLSEELPADMVPRGGGSRGIGTPPPQGPLAKWLAERYPAPSCVIIRWRRFTRIIKLSERGDIISVSARSIVAADRQRLVEAGILNKT